MTALHLIAAYLLGAISFGVFVLVVLVKVHKRPAPPPTKYRRKYRDAVVEMPPPWERGEVERCVRYEHLGMTGHESD